MSGSASNYLEQKLLDHAMGKASFTMPTTVAIALVTTLPTDASTGATLVEPSTSGTAYARKVVAASDLNSATSADPSVISNVNAITFATATGDGWGTIVGFAVCDNSTVGAGNVLFWGSLTSKTIAAGDTATFAGGSPGDLQLTMD